MMFPTLLALFAFGQSLDDNDRLVDVRTVDDDKIDQQQMSFQEGQWVSYQGSDRQVCWVCPTTNQSVVLYGRDGALGTDKIPISEIAHIDVPRFEKGQWAQHKNGPRGDFQIWDAVADAVYILVDGSKGPEVPTTELRHVVDAVFKVGDYVVDKGSTTGQEAQVCSISENQMARLCLGAPVKASSLRHSERIHSPQTEATVSATPVAVTAPVATAPAATTASATAPAATAVSSPAPAATAVSATAPAATAVSATATAVTAVSATAPATAAPTATSTTTMDAASPTTNAATSRLRSKPTSLGPLLGALIIAIVLCALCMWSCWYCRAVQKSGMKSAGDLHRNDAESLEAPAVNAETGAASHSGPHLLKGNAVDVRAKTGSNAKMPHSHGRPIKQRKTGKTPTPQCNPGTTPTAQRKTGAASTPRRKTGTTPRRILGATPPKKQPKA